MLRVPVGATVLMEIFRRPLFIILSYKSGKSTFIICTKSDFSSIFLLKISKGARVIAMSILESNSPSSFLRMSVSTNSKASVVSYLNPIAAMASPRAVKPNPVRRPLIPVSRKSSHVLRSAYLMCSDSGSVSILLRIRSIASSSKSTKSSIKRCVS